MTAQSQPLLTLTDAAAWRAWLDANEHVSDGVWLVLAKKGTTDPTSLSYQQALDEALCSGWIDGQKKSLDAALFQQRFTPRRKRSMWSLRNTGIVEDLIAQGRMRERGMSEIQLAKADGRWERAYAGSATIEVPADLEAAMAASPGAAAAFEALNRADRFSALHPLMSAPNETVRTTRLAKLLAKLEGS